ncbi:MAG: sugar phosphate isomerase/epimerase family protein [Eubacteriales bacterium]|nr:sugar phosphate isomerase/epimerase family protein [Eubacteriales bacterium]
MIRLGVCTGPANLETVANIGYDYIEFGLASIAALSEEEFAALAEKIDCSPIKAEAYNGMLPASVPVTGPDVNASQQHEYLELAFSRARRLGGKVVVFGSAVARNVPEGFPIDMAWRQIVNFLRLAERHAANYEITIAIEPLRKKESNIINYVSEAVLLASIHQLPHIRALGDTYHMAMGSEPLSALTLAGEMLAHVHTANAIGRKYPAPDDGEDYEAIFSALLEGGYEGRVSVEGACEDFAAEAQAAYSALVQAREAAMAAK